MQRGRFRRDGVVVDGDDDRTELAAVKAMKVGLTAAPALPLDRLGFRDVGEGAAARRTSCCVPGPSPPFNLALYSGAHQPLRVGRPRSGRRSRA